jgi:signal transduction histidine kinase
VGTHDIKLEGDPQLKITADEQLIEQVIVNLVNNAVKYAPGVKNIIIRIEKLNGAVKISVKDFGPGIPPENTKHIFKRYYQAEKGTREFSGLGLGLYISAEIIAKHGGTIGVNSIPGQGSTFWFTIPD